MLPRDLDHRLGLHDRTASGPERAVRHDVDALFLAQVHDLLLRQRRVVLDLVHCRDDGGFWEQLLQVLFAVLSGEFSSAEHAPRRKRTHVADTDRLCLAGRWQRLHLLPRVHMVVRADDVSRAVG
jgi:hypothetical protein